MTVQPPPLYEKLIDEEEKPRVPWALFFNQIYDGDAGTAWTPTFTSLTTSGTPTITGRYYKLSNYLVYFAVLIVPGTSTTATAGTTYIDNFPLTFAADGTCFAVSGGLGATPGHIVASTNRIYVPAWSAVTVPLTVMGLGEVAG